MFISLPESFDVQVKHDEDLISNRKEIIIGISLPVGGGEERWPSDSEYLRDYARKRNAVLKFSEMTISTSDQLAEVEKLLEQGIDALILAPVNSDEASIIVDKVKKYNIPVIAYDRFIFNADIDFFVAFNSLNIGELQGRYLTQRAPSGNYIILAGDLTDSNSILYKDGAMIYIKPLEAVGRIKIVTDVFIKDWNPDTAYDIVKKSLAANNNNIIAILSPNDAFAGASIKALKEQDLAGKVLVTGLDAEPSAIKRILEGTQSMTVFTDFRKEAETAIDIAIRLVDKLPLNIYTEINNGKKEVPSLLLVPITVDRNNVQEVLINSGYMTINEIYSLQN